MNHTAKWIVAVLGTALLGVGLFLRLQSVEPKHKPTDTKSAAEKTLERARSLVRESHDLGACRNVLQQVNRFLSQNPGERPAALSAQAREELHQQLALD